VALFIPLTYEAHMAVLSALFSGEIRLETLVADPSNECIRPSLTKNLAKFKAAIALMEAARRESLQGATLEQLEVMQLLSSKYLRSEFHGTAPVQTEEEAA
jgi:hypothetical protein